MFRKCLTLPAVTLGELFDYLSARPLLVLAGLLLPVAVAFFAGLAGRGRGYLQPWRSVYAVCVYASCIPGVFALSLLAYLFLFERQSIYALDVVTQLAPVLAMTATLLLISRNVDLAYVPGFGRISGLLAAIAGVLFLMYLAQRFRFIVFTYLPAVAALAIFGAVLAAVVWGWRWALREPTAISSPRG